MQQQGEVQRSVRRVWARERAKAGGARGYDAYIITSRILLSISMFSFGRQPVTLLQGTSLCIVPVWWPPK